MYSRVLALAATMLIVVLAGATSVFGKTASGGGAGRVEAKVLDQIAERGSTTFWVVLKDKADLRAAPSIRTAPHAANSSRRAPQDGRSKPGWPARAARAARRGLQAKLWILNSIRVTGGQALLDDLAGRPEVERIIAGHVFRSRSRSPGKASPRSTPLNGASTESGRTEVWSTFGDRGEGIVVANIDTGVRFRPPGLVAGGPRGNTGGGTFDHNYNWFDPSNVCGSPSLVPCDNNGHGTHTMGTMVGDDGAPGPRTRSA